MISARVSSMFTFLLELTAITAYAEQNDKSFLVEICLLHDEEAHFERQGILPVTTHTPNLSRQQSCDQKSF